MQVEARIVVAKDTLESKKILVYKCLEMRQRLGGGTVSSALLYRRETKMMVRRDSDRIEVWECGMKGERKWVDRIGNEGF